MTTYRHQDQLRAVVDLSHVLGDPSRDLVILAEGNTSVRVTDGMLVKASGASLAEATHDDFVELDLAEIENLLRSGGGDREVSKGFAAATRWGSKRPSVEALLHAVCYRIPEVKAVAHTHPTAVNALLCSSKANDLVAGSLFPDQIVVLGRNPLFLSYVDPGLPLAIFAGERLSAHVATYGVPKAIYLANHGLFALGGSAEETVRITQMAVKSARVLLGALSVGGAVFLDQEHASRIDTRPDEKYRREVLTAE